MVVRGRELFCYLLVALLPRHAEKEELHGLSWRELLVEVVRRNWDIPACRNRLRRDNVRPPGLEPLVQALYLVRQRCLRVCLV